MATPGPESKLTNELSLKIRGLILKGKKIISIQEQLEIQPGTWDQWFYEDYKDFRKDVMSWKRERLMSKAEAVAEETLDLDYRKPNGHPDGDVLKTIQKEAEFTRSTLGRNDGYSSRAELTGANGKDLPTPILANVHSDLSDKEGTETQ
jgi:hypothetical protein